MNTFPAYASNFELYPPDCEATHQLAPLFSKLSRIDFSFRVDDPTVNQGQLACSFDAEMEMALQAGGTVPFTLSLPPDVPQELDFAFSFEECTVAVEIEKANREKILRDILKSHIYLHAGARYALIVLPRNYAHKHGIWNLFAFGVERYNECRTYGFGTPDKLGRIALLGFDQYETATNRLLTKAIRKEWRVRAAAALKET
jgi:hypothetical protein